MNVTCKNALHACSTGSRSLVFVNTSFACRRWNKIYNSCNSESTRTASAEAGSVFGIGFVTRVWSTCVVARLEAEHFTIPLDDLG